MEVQFVDVPVDSDSTRYVCIEVNRFDVAWGSAQRPVRRGIDNRRSHLTGQRKEVLEINHPVSINVSVLKVSGLTKIGCLDEEVSEHHLSIPVQVS